MVPWLPLLERLEVVEGRNFLDWAAALPDNLDAMKNFLLSFVILLLGCTPALCQQQLDAATKEDVEELLTLTGARARVQQMWTAMAQQAATTAADAYRLKHPDATPLELRRIAEGTGQYMHDALNTLSIDELLDAIVPIYQRHFTHADVRTVIDFYSSPTGQKFLKEMPAMMAESMQAADPIVKKHLPEMEAAAEKAMEKAVKESEDGASPQKPN